ncbi:hypothetical protein ALSL_0472 [Aerosticca soli]|uniref:Uncharacterized protein n=1 Tax=Aerosticca soli TaxID=2010829 RepID=A0A2Z6E2G4_9GAMM|nr:hypothetical protein ALSL_0472 [Aerosticca soli]
MQHPQLGSFQTLAIGRLCARLGPASAITNKPAINAWRLGTLPWLLS